MYKYLPIILLAFNASAGPYLEVGLGVPLDPNTGYIPDQYGILSVGYIERITPRLSLDVGFHHRSLTGEDNCNNTCKGDNAIEAKFRLEW